MGFGGRIVSLLLAAASVAVAGAPPDDVDPELEAVQNHIATFDTPRGYYRTTYRYAEPRYWSFFPKWMREDAGTRTITRILDIGCGYGTLLTLAVKIYGAQGYCLDSTPYAAALARKDGLIFSQSNIELDPIPWKEKFDVIIMTEVIEHFNFHPAPTLEKIRAALAPGGLFFLSTPDARSWGRTTKYFKQLEDIPAPPPRPAKVIDDHIWVYDRADLLRVVKAAGLKVERFEISNPKSASHFNVLLRAAS